DKARTSASRLSENGLLEINRQRLKKALQLRTYRPCPTCTGTGTIASPELVSLNILRRIETRAVTGQLGGARVELHPELADALQNECRQELAALEREFDIQLQIVAAAGLHRAEERIEWRQRTKQEEKISTAAVSAADLADGVGDQPERTSVSESNDDGETAEREGPLKTAAKSDKPKPRRRRRGGRRRKKTAATENGVDAAGTDQEDDGEQPDEREAAQPVEDSDGEAPAKKSRRRRPRRSRKKAAQATQAEDAPSTESTSPEPEPPQSGHPGPTSSDPDPFAY
ncbi:MAG: hypothetical protein MUP13_09905, partial [Thermoanaerobaculales bacterium]|nr:hypothetical protein [Thermoanaerobaculales bacterium]